MKRLVAVTGLFFFFAAFFDIKPANASVVEYGGINCPANIHRFIEYSPFHKLLGEEFLIIKGRNAFRGQIPSSTFLGCFYSRSIEIFQNNGLIASYVQSPGKRTRLSSKLRRSVSR